MSKPIVQGSKRLALIDADGQLWAAAHAAETVMSLDGRKRQVQMQSFEATLQDAINRINRQIEQCEADLAFAAISDRVNFRKAIMPEGHRLSIRMMGYKGTRSAAPRPLLLDALRDKIQDEAPFKVLLVRGLEADDVCGISAGQFQAKGYDTVIVSPDKDLLQIPGKVITFLSGRPVETVITQDMADRWHLYQTLAGDTCDGYTGLPGWGPRKAGEALDLMALFEFDMKDRWDAVREIFTKAGYEEKELLELAQVSRILRDGEWDLDKKEPILFQFPTSQGDR